MSGEMAHEAESEQAPKWEGRIYRGEAMVKISDVLDWLRRREAAWAGTLDDSPSKVAGHLADELRDVWIEADRG